MKYIKLITIISLTLFSNFTYSALSSIESVDFNISKLKPGNCATVDWNKWPVTICRLTKQHLEEIKNKETGKLGDPNEYELLKSITKLALYNGNEIANYIFTMQEHVSRKPTRSIQEHVVILLNVSPYNGCSPTYRPEIAPSDLGSSWKGGFFNPCIGEGYDLAGRVIKSINSENLGNYWNLRVPPYRYISENVIRIGELPKSIKLKKYDFSPDLYHSYYNDSQRLFLASAWNNKKLAIKMLKKGLNPNKVNITGNYPLHAAVLSNNPALVKVLLDNGASPDIKNFKGDTPKYFAEFLKNKEILELFNEQK